MKLLYAILVLFGAEILLEQTVRRMRAQFQWLITEKDEMPELEAEGLKKFFNRSWDPDLGWTRRPDTEGTEKGKKGTVTYHIDRRGSRRNTVTDAEPSVATFGDSYVFCRQVEDEETWQVELSRRLGRGVLNFGVGNYGADQALLRYESTELPPSVNVAVLGFVPETICRVHSYWKHYLEFGNTFAFKPRFVLDGDGGLELLENPMRTPEHFDRLEGIVPDIRQNDGFYKRKFRSLQFRFPYLLSWLRHPVRHSRIMGALARRSVLRALGASTPKAERHPFRLVMEYNLKEAHSLYGDPRYTELLTAIIERFAGEARRRGHRPVLLVMPQMLDLELGGARRTPYQDYYEGLSEVLPVVDLTDRLRRGDRAELYIDDHYGGHLSAAGNRLVADAMESKIREMERQEVPRG